MFFEHFLYEFFLKTRLLTQSLLVLCTKLITMSKSNQVALDKPVAVEFTISMETDKAYIVKDLKLSGLDYIADTVLPKMYTQIDATSKGITKASVEAWVLEQRFDEQNNENIAMQLLQKRYSQAELASLPF